MNKKYSYNTISFIVFSTLIIGTLSFFTFADDTSLTLFEDFDRDGLSNAEEDSFGTDPKQADTDGDGYSDGVEVESGYNPLIPAPGDRIMQKKEVLTTISPMQTHTTNVTQKISEGVMSNLADLQESGETEVTSDDFSNMISEAIDEEVSFEKAPPIELSDMTLKETDYSDMSDNEQSAKEREDVIEYITALSYVLSSNFPQEFIESPAQAIQAKIMTEFGNYAQTLTDYSFFEDMADNAIIAKEQMHGIEVPAEMVDIHMRGLYLVSYIESLKKSESYKQAHTDITPLIATLAQLEGLIDLMIELQAMIDEKLEKYDVQDMLLDI